MRRLVPMLAVVLAIAGFAACGGNGGSGDTRAFCAAVRDLRDLGRDPGSTEPADPQELTATIAGLERLERAAPSDVRDDVATIRETLETIADLGAGKSIDRERIEQLEDSKRIRNAGESIDRQVKKCGLGVPSK